MRQTPKFTTEDGLLVYVDGAYTSGGAGGWAWVAVGASEEYISDSGFVPPPTTNNRMELTAPIKALTYLHKVAGPCELQIVCDSRYVVGAFTDNWLAGWHLSNWKNGKVKNIDLWQQLEAAVALHNYVEWRHVLGHIGVKYNELADELAVTAKKGATWQ